MIPPQSDSPVHPALRVPAFLVPPSPNYLKLPALGQSAPHTPRQTFRGWDHLPAEIAIPCWVKPRKEAT